MLSITTSVDEKLSVMSGFLISHTTLLTNVGLRKTKRTVKNTPAFFLTEAVYGYYKKVLNITNTITDSCINHAVVLQYEPKINQFIVIPFTTLDKNHVPFYKPRTDATGSTVLNPNKAPLESGIHMGISAEIPMGNRPRIVLQISQSVTHQQTLPQPPSVQSIQKEINNGTLDLSKLQNPAIDHNNVDKMLNGNPELDAPLTAMLKTQISRTGIATVMDPLKDITLSGSQLSIPQIGKNLKKCKSIYIDEYNNNKTLDTYQKGAVIQVIDHVTFLETLTKWKNAIK
jgi:hypothetical protein